MAKGIMPDGSFLGHLYCVLNSENGKRYVGVTTRTVQLRWLHHLAVARRGGGSRLHQAIRKYGKGSFEVEHILSSLDRIEMFEMERAFILRLRTYGPDGYNMTAGGEGMLAAEFSEQTRLKLGQASKDRWQDPEMRQRIISSSAMSMKDPTCRVKMSKASKRSWSDDDYASNQIRLAKARWEDAAYRAKVIEAQKQAKSTESYKLAEGARAIEQASRPETRAKISSSMKARWDDAAYRSEMGAKFQDAVQSPTARAIRSEKARARLASPEARKALAERSRQLWADPAYREKMARRRRPTKP